MTSGSEIERKFLVAEVPGDLDAFPSETIEQGYVAIDGPVEVRLRLRTPRGGEAAGGGRALLTVKSGAGRVRVEEELEIDERLLRSLWPLSEGRRVSKTRYRLPTGDGLTIELDLYSGSLDGLAVAEVEFDSQAASEGYQPADWLGAEVTDDIRWANRALAVDGAPPEGAAGPP